MPENSHVSIETKKMKRVLPWWYLFYGLMMKQDDSGTRLRETE